MMTPFKDRREAGQLLADALLPYLKFGNVLIFALPRGGVPVGYEVAKALKVELDVLVVRKLGLPSQPEVAMGAISSGDAIYLNQRVIDRAKVSQSQIDAVLETERKELSRREILYRGIRPTVKVEGRTVIVVDDGIATGATMRAAILALRGKNPARIIVAVPVAPSESRELFDGIADGFVCLLTPSDFYAVGQFYEEFGATEDDEVRALLSELRQGAH